MLISEVILENFMSYEYARVEFQQGVNLIVGPNGAGKSSLLLAISVALGQSYTERSKKLSNLIRWGENQARITLILDNSKRSGKRPVSKYSKDQIFLTRVLRRDGTYWFELENRAANKHEIQHILSKFGVDPDNMLIIMHQNMVEQFSILSKIDKLRMVEAAVGLEPFRENVIQAQQKLSRILSQEESVSKLLENAEQTLNYWREQYEKYQEKKQLQTKRRFLERELGWAEVEKKEKTIKELEAAKEREEETFKGIEDENEKIINQIKEMSNQIDNYKEELKNILNERLNLEREDSENKASINLLEQILTETKFLKEAMNNFYEYHQLNILRPERCAELIEKFQTKLQDSQIQIKNNKRKSNKTESRLEKLTNTFLENKINIALQNYLREKTKVEQKKIETMIKSAIQNLQSAITKASESGARIAVIKSINEIIDEIRITDGHLAALSGVSEDIERQYESYSKLFLELKEKAQVVAENRQKAIQEISTRMNTWRIVMQNLLDRVNFEYKKIMAQTRAIGEVQLSNAQEIETAGLEILVGFKGGKPVPLDAYTQSGGERTTATMSFLLALQQHVRSPFRAVDEYDVHMDPKNREMIAKILISTIKDANIQYIVITPSQVTFAQENANIVTVQNVEGKSIVKEVV